MIKMLIVVVACYTVCWLPFNIFWVISMKSLPTYLLLSSMAEFQVWGLFNENIMSMVSSPYIFTVVHMMAVSHTCYNPFIYCWMNNRVRHGFLNVLGNLAHIYSNLLQSVEVCKNLLEPVEIYSSLFESTQVYSSLFEFT